VSESDSDSDSDILKTRTRDLDTRAKFLVELSVATSGLDVHEQLEERRDQVFLRVRMIVDQIEEVLRPIPANR
jgi:hypothetical protein